MPGLTVLTPCRNAAAFIAECVESVAAQGEVVERHLVLDGASDDGTVEILEDLQKRYPRLEFTSERDGGQSAALAKGLAMVETEWFGWLNADDYYLQDGLAELARGVTSKNDQNYSIVYGDYVNVDINGDFLSYRKQPTFSRWDCIHGYLTVLNAAAIFNTSIARETDGFDPSFRFAMDYDLVLKLASAGPVKHVSRAIAVFRRHEDAKTSQLLDVYEEEIEMLRKQHGGHSRFSRGVLKQVAKARVFTRMLTQGALDCRLPLLKNKFIRPYVAATVRAEI